MAETYTPRAIGDHPQPGRRFGFSKRNSPRWRLQTAVVTEQREAAAQIVGTEGPDRENGAFDSAAMVTTMLDT